MSRPVFERYRNPFFDEIKPYIPGPTIEEISAVSGLPPSRIIKLSSNENPTGAPPLAIKQVVNMAKYISLYPDSQAKDLRRAIAEWLDMGFTTENIIVGAGSSEIMSFIIRSFTRPLDEVIATDPSFTVYPEVTLADGRRPVIIRLQPPEFDLEIEDVREALTERTRVIFLTRPNNPTSRLIPLEAVQRITEVVKDAIIVCDEAYIEFSDDFRKVSATQLVDDDANVIVTRTFSKVFGLCDLRVGYAVGPKQAIRDLFKVKPKWNVGMVAQTAAIAALKDTEHFEKTIEVVRVGRKYLANKLSKLGLEVVPNPQGNFLFVKVTRLGITAGELAKRLRERGISIRGGPTDWGDDYVRISIGTMPQNRALVHAIQELANV